MLATLVGIRLKHGESFKDLAMRKSACHIDMGLQLRSNTWARRCGRWLKHLREAPEQHRVQVACGGGAAGEVEPLDTYDGYAELETERSRHPCMSGCPYEDGGMFEEAEKCVARRWLA
jgi:hypothetical protein